LVTTLWLAVVIGEPSGIRDGAMPGYSGLATVAVLAALDGAAAAGAWLVVVLAQPAPTTTVNGSIIARVVHRRIEGPPHR
jgi:hypothetical protein